MEEFEKCHRYLIQFMLKNGVATIPRALQFCSKIENETVNETKLKVIVNQINTVISNQFFKISFSKCEVTEEEMLVWMNLKNDELSRGQLSFNEKELEYFHALLTEIINSEQRKLMFVVCLNITSTLTTVFSRDSGLHALNKWIEGGYFVRDGEFIHFGPRLILEFTTYLKSHRPECTCFLCSDLCFTGKICDNCDKIFHLYCIGRYLQSQTSCPNCKEDWSDAQVFKNLENLSQNSHVDEDMSVDRTDEVSEEAGPSQRRTRKK